MKCKFFNQGVGGPDLSVLVVESTDAGAISFSISTISHGSSVHLDREQQDKLLNIIQEKLGHNRSPKWECNS